MTVFVLADLNDRPRWWELNSLSVYSVQSFNTKGEEMGNV
jgi:hypothetical protein